MSNHAMEDYFTQAEADAIVGAAAMARVTGSRGTTERRESRNAEGQLVVTSEVTVEAIDQIEGCNKAWKIQSWGPAYRVPTHQNMVIVMRSRPGRFKSHAK
ncbi:hypothetical protein MYRNA_139 [Mycobacterium phage Myrna]|uniref:Uncharacterized protein n=1 Tax=Mycobacterium phage Myrna TaxID=546805 RepID=B5LJE3_9CAUD|nr:gp139 [Mycobacterium phage Myrna]ACH62140.1 hypothetical protein MYRNA_139 [Mycobacterium phage Myrna]